MIEMTTIELIIFGAICATIGIVVTALLNKDK